MKKRDQIDEDLKKAMRQKDEAQLNALRSLKTAIRNREVEIKDSLDERAFLQVVKTLVKQRRESIEQFNKANREDLAAGEESELKVLSDYLPPQLSEDEVESIVDEVISESGAQGPKDIGKVMKRAMERIGSRQDGKFVNSVVIKKLKS